MKTVFYIFLFFIFISSSAQTTVNTNLRILEGTQIIFTNAFHIEPSGIVINDGELVLKGNLINNGTLSYTPTSTASTVYFSGNVQQVLGNQSAIFYNVLFNNNNTILEGDIEVNNDVDFIKGIVQNDETNGQFLFTELSDHINTSNLSFVNGNVLKKGSLDFSFPIGKDSYYRPISIEGLTSENIFLSRYFKQNSNILYPHELKEGIINFIDNKEYWELKREEGTDYAMLTISRNAETSSSEIMNTVLNDLHIVRWDVDKNYWIDEGGIAMPDSDAIKTFTKITGFGVFALATIQNEGILTGNVTAYNNITPNGDGINDALILKGIEKFPDNVVRIFNRWGAIVSEIKGYDNLERVFKGYATKGIVLQKSEPLPSGTYFYSLEYTINEKRIKEIKYLFINGK